MTLYTDNDSFCCKVLRARIADGSLPEGDVLEKDIREVTTDDLAGYEVIHLFAGIGGFGLAQKWAGWKGSLLTGGFPCQDISLSGPGTGLSGERSGLWRQMVRAIRLVRPRYAIVENVAALLGRGMGRVLGDLAESGADAEWNSLPTGISFGHRRERTFIVADFMCAGLSERGNARPQHSNGAGIFKRERFASILTPAVPREKWADRPLLGRDVPRIPRRAHRITALGNAIVPQVAEQILRAMRC